MAREKYQRQGTPCHAEPGQRRNSTHHQPALRLHKSGGDCQADIPDVRQRFGAYPNRKEAQGGASTHADRVLAQHRQEMRPWHRTAIQLVFAHGGGDFRPAGICGRHSEFSFFQPVL